MSSVPPFADPSPPQAQPQAYGGMPAPRNEDCRDYLRTGRCKYGASCKYRHPPNVQSGGGMRAPIDPSEPLFPVRRNEPPCQYFLKHGTCKFGQSCKFNHPPEARFGVPTTPVRKPEVAANQVVVNSADGPVVLQFLPQRPEEPDCIYFLKNGRCKYGATCRYHHPVNYHKRRAEELRRQQLVQAQDFTNGHHYNNNNNNNSHSQAGNANGGYGAGMPEGNVPFHHYDSSGLPQGLQPISVILGPDGVPSYGAPVGSTMPSTDHGSSASSIASSYDTAPAGVDHFAAESWARARRNGSGNSLAAFAIDTSGRGGTGTRRMTQSTSDNNIAARHRHRAASFGSAGGGEAPYTQEQSRMSRSGSVGSWRAERAPASHAFDSSGRQYRQSRQDQQPQDPLQQQRSSHRSSPRGRGSRGDEGFTMMTSALLTMLDTPEEASMESYSDEDPRSSRPHPQAPQHQWPSSQDRVPTHVEPQLFDRLSISDSSPYPPPDLGKRMGDSLSRPPTKWQPPPLPPYPTTNVFNGPTPATNTLVPGQEHGRASSQPSDVGQYFP